MLVRFKIRLYRNVWNGIVIQKKEEKVKKINKKKSRKNGHCREILGFFLSKIFFFYKNYFLLILVDYV